MCRMWSLVDLEHKTRHQVFSRAQSFHASTIAIIVTLALPQIHLKVWPLFNWMYNKHLVQVTQCVTDTLATSNSTAVSIWSKLSRRLLSLSPPSFSHIIIALISAEQRGEILARNLLS